jgi:hypothetical protein
MKATPHSCFIASLMEIVGQSYMIRGDELLVKIAKIE